MIMKKDFYRKIGYGLRPDDDVPADPIKWAEAQIEKPAPLTWPGDIPTAKGCSITVSIRMPCVAGKIQDRPQGL